VARPASYPITAARLLSRRGNPAVAPFGLSGRFRFLIRFLEFQRFMIIFHSSFQGFAGVYNC
ncbi:hypothetical protein ACCS96_36430, partial [Rhizobium ruizarguesonis]